MKYLLPVIALLAGCADLTPDQSAAMMRFGQALLVRQPVQQYQQQAVDYDWDWDEFYYNGNLIWACRGINTGRFAEQWRCASKVQTDFRWPAKFL